MVVGSRLHLSTVNGSLIPRRDLLSLFWERYLFEDGLSTETYPAAILVDT